MAPCAVTKTTIDVPINKNAVVESLPDHPTMTPALSSRGQRHGAKVTPFWDTFDRIIGNSYCHLQNPNGIVNMAISNNYLLEPELLEYFQKNLQMHPTDLTYGTSLFGSHRLFATLCKHFNSSTFSPHTSVEPRHLITGPGCGPLLDQLSEHLCEPGDGVLIAAPYYNGYDADLGCRGEVQCIPVYSDQDDGSDARNFQGPSALRQFDQAKQQWEAKNSQTGNKVAAVIVCNPHNPVGRCYDRQALLEYGRFAEQHNLHVVFDEIFALSTYASNNETCHPFYSALSIDWQSEAGCNPARIHVIWSASKDFGINGLRIGTLISQGNAGLLRAMKATAKLYMVSSPADALFCSLIENKDVYHDFIQTNKDRMAQAYDITTRWAQHHQIAFTPCSAGHFILVDLQRFLPTDVDGAPLHDDAAREGALWTKLLEHNVCLTPGSNYHHCRLGVFRLTFTLRRHALLEGLTRLERALELPSWPARWEHEIEQLPEPIMKTLLTDNLEVDASSSSSHRREQSMQTSQTLDSDLQHRSNSSTLDTQQADAGRLHYVSAVRKVLAQGGGQEALLSCGMGMSCSACC